jgi:hypothetical protein
MMRKKKTKATAKKTAATKKAKATKARGAKRKTAKAVKEPRKSAAKAPAEQPGAGAMSLLHAWSPSRYSTR